MRYARQLFSETIFRKYVQVIMIIMVRKKPEAHGLYK